LKYLEFIYNKNKEENIFTFLVLEKKGKDILFAYLPFPILRGKSNFAKKINFIVLLFYITALLLIIQLVLK